MLRHFIQKVRRKPKAVRDNIALGIAGATTALVLGGWVLINNQSPLSGVAGELSTKTGAFSGLIGQIKDQAASAFSSVPSKDELESIIEADKQQSASSSSDIMDTPVSEETATTSSSTSTTTRTVRIATTTNTTNP